jgi:hypothetical protein
MQAATDIDDVIGTNQESNKESYQGEFTDQESNKESYKEPIKESYQGEFIDNENNLLIFYRRQLRRMM